MNPKYMRMKKKTCDRIAGLIFLVVTMASILFLDTLNFPKILSLTGGIFIAIITSGFYLEVSYRLLVEEATAPLTIIARKI